MEKDAHILVMRFSALGDVAMTVPVIRNLLTQHPSLQVTMVSDPFMEPLFKQIPRLHFIGANTKKDYRGLSGLFRLSRELRRRAPFTGVADLHNVLRTKILRLFLALPAEVIDKGRKEKKELTRPVNKNLRPLKSGFQRYADVFEKLGYLVQLNIDAGLAAPRKPKTNIGIAKIGIAPFARHAAKMLPLEKTEALVKYFAANDDLEILLFGSPSEKQLLDQWATKYSRVKVIAGSVNFEKELSIIKGLDLMFSMDSANMHLASLYGVPVVSTWGGTHPWLGFYGWGQDYRNTIQMDLPCRPSSVFGNKACPVHGEAGCMQDIDPSDIYERMMSVVKTLPR